MRTAHLPTTNSTSRSRSPERRWPRIAATITSATATVGVGTETEANVGPPCTSGTLLHIKLIGTFPTIVVGGAPTDNAPTASADYSVTAVLITADPASGKACLVGVQTGASNARPRRDAAIHEVTGSGQPADVRSPTQSSFQKTSV